MERNDHRCRGIGVGIGRIGVLALLPADHPAGANKGTRAEIGGIGAAFGPNLEPAHEPESRTSQGNRPPEGGAV